MPLGVLAQASPALHYRIREAVVPAKRGFPGEPALGDWQAEGADRA